MNTAQETKINSVGSAYRRRASLTVEFIVWYYGRASRSIVDIWGNYLQAVLHFFSMGLLLRTLISPWHRDTTGYGRGFDFKRYLEVFSLNMVSRGVGFVVRATVIAIGLCSELIILVLGFCFLAFWLVAPVALFVLLIMALGLLFG